MKKIKVVLKNNPHVCYMAVVLRKVETLYDDKGNAHQVLVCECDNELIPVIGIDDNYKTL